MSPPDADSPGSTGPPDRQTLRLLERHLSSESLVDETAFEPETHEPRLLRAVLDAEQYPTSTASARLDIRWFTTGDFSFHYIETAVDGSQWECRWDRHPNSHSARVHFHQPPDGTTITDLSLSSLHPLAVYATVLGAVEQRLERLWSTK
jgi:hypothetical protein